MEGKATLTTVTSSTTMNWASASNANITHLLLACLDNCLVATQSLLFICNLTIIITKFSGGSKLAWF